MPVSNLCLSILSASCWLSVITVIQFMPSYMSPNAWGGEVVAGSQPMSTAVQWSPNKLWRSRSIFNRWLLLSCVNIRVVVVECRCRCSMKILFVGAQPCICKMQLVNFSGRKTCKFLPSIFSQLYLLRIQINRKK
jgi:hypothetical protein